MLEVAEEDDSSSPGAAGVAVEEQSNTVIKTSANVDSLIRAYLSAREHDTWCLPRPEDCIGAFSPRTSKKGAVRNAEQKPNAKKQPEDHKRKWLDEEGLGLRVPEHHVAELG
jgi:hypothetical protein